MERIKKADLQNILYAHEAELLASNDRRRRADGRRLKGFNNLVEYLPFASVEARHTTNGNLNIGDIAEQLAKVLLKAVELNSVDFKNRTMYSSTARGFDAVVDGERAELKSAVLNPSSPIKDTSKKIFALTANGLYEFEPNYFKTGERVTYTRAEAEGLPVAIISDTGIEW